MIGTGAVAKAKPDGYTLLVASGEIAVNPHLYPKMAYDMDKDLQPITLMVKVPNVMAVIWTCRRRPWRSSSPTPNRSREAHLLVERRRQSAAIERRALQQNGGREDHTRALQRRGAAAC